MVGEYALRQGYGDLVGRGPGSGKPGWRGQMTAMHRKVRSLSPESLAVTNR